jgi:hypothetical protein
MTEKKVTRSKTKAKPAVAEPVPESKGDELEGILDEMQEKTTEVQPNSPVVLTTGEPSPNPSTTLTVHFEFEREHKHVNRFSEIAPQGEPEIMGKIYVSKHCTLSKLPRIKITVERDL